MLALIVLAVAGIAQSAVLDPSLTEWRLIESNEERVMFPLKEYILEVKAFLPDVFDTNPPYGELFRTDKSSTMMMLLHEGSWNSKVGRLVWNTIKYDRGYDVNVEECDVRYEAYNSFPAQGRKEQIWAWNFFEEFVLLTCDGELQYSQYFNDGDVNPRKPGLPEKCAALGRAQVDRIVFKHMEGFYIRGRPMESEEAATTPGLSTTPTASAEPDNIVYDKEVGACSCWTPECSYCNNLECTVKQDLTTSDQGVQVTTKLKWKKLNTIVLYDQAGKELGKFRFSLSGIYLTGCIGCQAPRALRKMRNVEGKTAWTFALKDGVVQIRVSSEVVYEQELIGECKEVYSKVRRYAFYDMTCEDTFLCRASEMEAGLFWETQPNIIAN